MSLPARIAHTGHNLGQVSDRTAFRGASTSLIPQPNPRLSISEIGVATLQRKWWCRKDLAPSFLPKRGERDDLWRDLAFIDCDVSDAGDGSYITENYNGIIGGDRAPVVIERITYPRREVTLHNSVGSLVLVYKCPKRHRRWAALTADEDKPGENPIVAPEFAKMPQPLFFKEARGLEVTGNGATAELLRAFGFRIENQRTLDIDQQGHVFVHDEIIERQIVQISPADVDIIRALNSTPLLS